MPVSHDGRGVYQFAPPTTDPRIHDPLENAKAAIRHIKEAHVQRELTRDEKLFFMTRALIQNRRDNLVREVRDFIAEEWPAAHPEGFAMEVDDFLGELLAGTGWQLNGYVERVEP